ncbi:glycosyltransferase family 9 protein [Ferrovibrio sp.]|uniref:glycosyltransferase family 9 protein n=1 Tax=Ferrovibrio sp. TaxID=1917215 RepID=UPI002632E422|nr:glycosyltransferase family 9 protein [Ferrovibrio sp.]
MRILFITSNRLGDAILSTGLLDSLHSQFPKARFTIACGPAAASLFTAMPNLDRVIVMQKKPWAGHWWELWKQVATTRWWLVLDLRGSGIGQFLLARRRRSFHGSGSRMHKVIVLSHVLKLKTPAAPRVWISEDHKKAAAKLWPNDGRPTLALGPTANWGGKIWPGERFAELALRLTAENGILPNGRIVVFGGPGEEALAADTLSRLPVDRSVDLVGKLDLPTISAALRRCDFYIGNDSGLMHLAAASEVPTLGLFGPSREETYGPWGEKTAAVRTDLSFEDIIKQPGYDYRSQDSHMLTLSVDKAQRAAEHLWRYSRD